jgi:hypothetical protein
MLKEFTEAYRVLLRTGKHKEGSGGSSWHREKEEKERIKENNWNNKETDVTSRSLHKKGTVIHR